jgi:predicted dehydrogenase
MKITPYIAGWGMAGKGMAKALEIIKIINPDFTIAEPIIIKKGTQTLQGLGKDKENPLLLIGNPHGLHAQMILDGVAAGFQHIVTDKPVCIRKDDISRLREVKADVAVTHGFRQHWGPQTIKKMIHTGEFGELISIEGRYWQCSMAAAAVAGEKPSSVAPEARAAKDWKNDASMNGPYDALVDLGAHYTDLMLFLAGAMPQEARGWVSHVNSPAPHRDSHAHVEFIFPHVRARGSISKTVHGTGNDLEVMVLGSKQAVTWNVERPDELRIARGTTTTLMQKGSDKFGSQQPPFHGLGWLEGYVSVLHSYLLKKSGQSATYPTLNDSLNVMEVLLNLKTQQ